MRDERRACIQATSGKSDLISSQGISVPTLLEAAKSGSLYCSGKAPVEVLVESWPTCSIESWESAFFSRRYRLNRDFLEFLCRNWCSYRFETGVSGNLWSCPNEAKPIVQYDGEWSIALKPVHGNWSSLQLDLGYTEVFHIPAVTSVSF